MKLQFQQVSVRHIDILLHTFIRQSVLMFRCFTETTKWRTAIGAATYEHSPLLHTCFVLVHFACLNRVMTDKCALFSLVVRSRTRPEEADIGSVNRSEVWLRWINTAFGFKLVMLWIKALSVSVAGYLVTHAIRLSGSLFQQPCRLKIDHSVHTEDDHRVLLFTLSFCVCASVYELSSHSYRLAAN